MTSDETLRGVGQRCLGLRGVTAADVTTDNGDTYLSLVVEDRDRVPPSVLAVLAGGGVGIETVDRQGAAIYVRCR